MTILRTIHYFQELQTSTRRTGCQRRFKVTHNVWSKSSSTWLSTVSSAPTTVKCTWTSTTMRLRSNSSSSSLIKVWASETKIKRIYSNFSGRRWFKIVKNRSCFLMTRHRLGWDLSYQSRSSKHLVANLIFHPNFRLVQPSSSASKWKHVKTTSSRVLNLRMAKENKIVRDLKEIVWKIFQTIITKGVGS